MERICPDSFLERVVSYISGNGNSNLNDNGNDNGNGNLNDNEKIEFYIKNITVHEIEKHYLCLEFI
ncbi:MAG: hypothetical protein GY705_21750 [Bacteroidetes bacterium]|nr:hypothetical protein [Bacteroidota bacterium]